MDGQTNVKVEAVMSDEVKFHVTLARLETKIDLVLSQHGQRLEDHESRIRSVEERKTVSPSQLLASSATVIALMGGTFTILDRVVGK
jgi:hypothetical protein